MKMIQSRAVYVVAAAFLLTMLAGCQRTQVEQRGFRGQGMMQTARPAELAALAEVNKVPVPLRKVSATGPTAAEEYQNVQVLGDLSKAEFARLMLSFKTWVAPDEGCNFCHNAPDYASDAKYPKVVARAMIGMTRHINSNWKTHVAATGVTCYTCHRGQAVPPKVWFAVPEQAPGYMVRKPSERSPTPSAALSVLSVDPLSDHLLRDDPIRIVGNTALQSGNPHSINQARSTYALMMVMTDSLGVNCTYCHNTQAFVSWKLSPPARTTAWYGIRMARELNNAYMVPLASLLPPARFGPAGDGPKIYCATCHLGTNKPLNGANMVQHFPELVGPKSQTAAQAPLAASSVVENAGKP